MGYIEQFRTIASHLIGTKLFFIVKRIFDVVVSLILLIFFMPLMIVIGWIIFKKEGPEILFKEPHVGKSQRLFLLYSFRTTSHPSKVIRAFPPHPFPNTWDKGVPNTFTFYRDDQRIYTSLGLKLRKYKLDKLPQLWNIVKGDLSFIGPEPERPEIVDYYNRKQLGRLKVRPGLTGYAQNHQLTNMNHKKKITYDLYYVQNASYLFEIKIVFQAIKRYVNSVLNYMKTRI